MSIHFELSETFRASPERVFEALLDLEGAHRWMPGLVRIEPLTRGPLQAGSRWRETRRMLGKEATEEFQLVTFRRPERLELLVDGSKGSSGRGYYRFTYGIRPTASGTHVRLTGSIGGLNGVMGLLGRLFVGTYKKACAKDLTALKLYLDGSSDGGPDSVDPAA